MSKILTLSKKAIEDLIIEQEVSSRDNYNKRLQYPIWPGGLSGITIALGYDLGYVPVALLKEDLYGLVPAAEIDQLGFYCGKVGFICKRFLPINIKISWDQALKLFYATSLVKYAKLAASVYDELETLHPYEQTAIVGLVYNRGASVKGDRRREMLELIQAVKDDDDKMMASLLRQMKRLWDEKKQGGLIKRRELEAVYVEAVDNPIPEDDKLYITV